MLFAELLLMMIGEWMRIEFSHYFFNAILRLKLFPVIKTVVATLWCTALFNINYSTVFAQHTVERLEAIATPSIEIAREFEHHSRRRFHGNDIDKAIEYIESAASIYKAEKQWTSYIHAKYLLSVLWREKGWKIEEGFQIALSHLSDAEWYSQGISINKVDILDKIFSKKVHLFVDQREFESGLKTIKKISFMKGKTEEHCNAFMYYQRGRVSADRIGDFDESNSYIKKSQPIFESNKSWLKAVQTYKRIACNLRIKGRYEEAIEYLFKGYAITEKKNLANTPEKRVVGELLTEIGKVYGNKGDFENAINYTEKALLLWQTRLKYQEGYEAYIAMCNINLGSYFIQIGELNKAFGYLQDAESHILSSYAPNDPIIIDCYTKLGKYYAATGKHDLAMNYYYKNIDWLKKNITVRTDIKRLIAENYILIGKEKLTDYTSRSALGAFENAFHYFQEVSHPLGAAESCQLIARYYSENKMFDKALEYHQKAFTILSKDTIDYTISGENPEATDVPMDMIVVNLLKEKSDVYLAKYCNSSNINHLVKCFETLEAASEFVEKYRTSYLSSETIYQLVQNTYSILEKGVMTAYSLFEETENPVYLEKAFQMTDKSKYAILKDAMNASKFRDQTGLPDSLLIKEKKLRYELTSTNILLRKQLQKHKFADSLDNKLTNLYETIRFNLQSELDGLKTNFSKYPGLENILKVYSTPPSFSEIQKHLNPETLFLEYFISKNHLLIFVISDSGISIKSIPIDENFLALCQSFMQSLRKDSARSQFPELSYQLYQILIEPVLGSIQGKTDLIIIPDEALIQIPFECLLTEKPDTQSVSDLDYKKLPYFLYKQNISYYFSSGLFLRSNTEKQSQHLVENSFLGIAPTFDDAIFDSDSPLDLSFISSLIPEEKNATDDQNNIFYNALPNSRKEVSEIIRSFKNKNYDTKGLYSQQATEDNFKKLAGKYKYIHLATHSFVDMNEPDLSGIAYYHPFFSESENDGVLYAGEIYNMELNADLLVLSSCESGSGLIMKGEGVLAVSRGFLLAGAKNLVVSQWKVADTPTSELMIHFYNNILEGQTYRKALKNAKIKLLENTDTAFPRFWSAFMLIGN